jgi:hypothetical protein
MDGDEVGAVNAVTASPIYSAFIQAFCATKRASVPDKSDRVFTEVHRRDSFPVPERNSSVSVFDSFVWLDSYRTV